MRDNARVSTVSNTSSRARGGVHETWLVLRADTGIATRYEDMGAARSPGRPVVVEAVDAAHRRHRAAATPRATPCRLQSLLRSARKAKRPRCDSTPRNDGQPRAYPAWRCATSSRGKSDLLNVHAAQTPRQQVVEESFAVTPDVAWSVETDEATSNRVAQVQRARRRSPRRGTKGWSTSGIASSIRPTQAEAPAELPVHSLRFLYPSRYVRPTRSRRKRGTSSSPPWLRPGACGARLGARQHHVPHRRIAQRHHRGGHAARPVRRVAATLRTR